MPQVKVSSKQRRVLFHRGKRLESRLLRGNARQPDINMAEDEDSSSPSASVSRMKIIEIDDEDTDETLLGREMAVSRGTNINVAAKPIVPSLFTTLPQLQDHVCTESSILQDSTVRECLPFLAGTTDQDSKDYNAYGVPRLRRELHLEYLYDSLEPYPSTYLGYDASRPWVLYWSLTGLSVLGENVESYAER